jgi:cyclopropane fatty-acyl-phospholipid synthase-like methyltransferase
MDNLKERAKFWSDHYFAETHGKSMKNPFELTPGWNKLYYDRKVLEIGPGEGRQSDILMAYTNHYCIADISHEVLKQDKFKDCIKTYLISEWDGNLEEEYDTICFWYVLHHIKVSEGAMFFEFLKRFLSISGTLHFNYPATIIGGSSSKNGDGFKTSGWTSELVHDCLEFYGFGYTEVVDEPSNNRVIKASMI